MSDRKIEARPGTLEPVSEAALFWRHVVPPGVTLEMVRRPDYWRNVVRECAQSRVAGRTPWNRLEVICEDGTWEAELRILSAADGLVQTRVIREWHAEAKPGRKPQVPEGYVVEFIRDNGWRALDPNGVVLSSRLPVEDDAIRAAATHARKAKGEP